MTTLQKLADLGHKAIVLGLMSFTGFQGYQLTTKAYTGYMEKDKVVQHPQKEYIEALQAKNVEQSKLSEKVDYREWYDPEDKSYVEQQAPITSRPKPKQ
jgi:hypothetical protein